MADYYLRLHRIFPGKKIYQVVIYLRKTKSELAWQTTFDLPPLHHEYKVIRLWEVPTEELLTSPGLLPFAVLSKTENPESILEKVAKQIETITDETDKVNITATTAILAGLVLDKMIIRRLLREEIMKESVIYQEIESIGEAKGEARGIAKGEANLILRLLDKRFGKISVDLTEQIRGLSLEKLDSLGESLLDFESIADLINWLNNFSNQ
jgi:predicted transposase YdaD